MNVLVVDTSSWISYFKKGNKKIDDALREGRVFLPSVVAAEILSGISGDSQRKKMKEFLSELPLCDNALDHWIRVGELRLELAKKGLTVSTPDAHIAQCGIDLDGYVLSEDKIFRKMNKLKSFRLLFTL